MAATITPGYDFQVNEIPTRAKLTAMLAGISLAAITRTQIDANIINAVYGDSGTSLPGEGWIWVDRTGNVWTTSRWGLTKLRRTGGGMSTMRFSSNVILDSYGTFPVQNAAGRGFILNRLYASGDTNESNVHWHLSNNNDDPPSLRNEETATSGLHTRWCLRGFFIVPLNSAAGTRGFPDLFHRNTVNGQQTFERQPIPVTNPTAADRPFFGIARRSNVPGANSAFAWLYGLGMKIF